MSDLPPLVPTNWQRARLPALYERARQILIECESVDECRQWAMRAEAIASYYKQAHDETLVAIARRIQLRAWRRIGELLKEADRTIDIDAYLPKGGHTKAGGTLLGEASGMTGKELTEARKLASLSSDAFERIVDRADPPTRSTVVRAPTETKETRGHERLASHLRALSALFRKFPPNTFPSGSYRQEDLAFVRECLNEFPAVTRSAA